MPYNFSSFNSHQNRVIEAWKSGIEKKEKALAWRRKYPRDQVMDDDPCMLHNVRGKQGREEKSICIRYAGQQCPMSISGGG